MLSSAIRLSSASLAGLALVILVLATVVPAQSQQAKRVEIARGLVAYDCADAALIAGRKTSEIATALGFRGRDEMVHRDDLVMTSGARS